MSNRKISNTDPPNSSPTRILLPRPTGVGDVCFGMILQAARKYLFADVKVKAGAYFVMVLILSFIADYIPFSQSFYFVQSHNIFNRYGTKLGWFWTCLLTIPFILLTSFLHHGSRTKAFRDLTRIFIATFVWSYSTNAFMRYEQHTARCHGAEHALRHTCDLEGGKWVPGFDISGHSFLLIYSILVICEEASSFRYWPSTPLTTTSQRRISTTNRREEYDFFQKYTKYVQYLFVGLFILHLFWDVQLVITVLYYHQFLHKIMGALVAVFCWFITYRIWYPLAFPFLPIRRHLKGGY